MERIIYSKEDEEFLEEARKKIKNGDHIITVLKQIAERFHAQGFDSGWDSKS